MEDIESILRTKHLNSINLSMLNLHNAHHRILQKVDMIVVEVVYLR